jgi:hypothetical protein
MIPAMYSYSAYGLEINSEFLIPEFVASNAGNFDVSIRSSLPAGVQVDFSQENPYYYSAEDSTFLKIPSIGIFSIRQGRVISIFPEDGLDPDRLHLYLTGNIFAFLLLQRGYFVLHASAASVAGRAAAFLGMPGSGKSSLVAALHQLGHAILVDDVTAVDLKANPVSVIPAFPQIKLDLEAAKSQGIDPETLIPLDDLEEKRGFRFVERFQETSQPLSKIYILSNEGDQIFQPLNSQDAIVELIRNSYPTRFAQAGGAGHFHQCVELVKQVPVFRLKKPPTLDGLPEFAALLADHI